MKNKSPATLSRRERQIMDVLYEHTKCSARDIHQSLQDAPSYSSVRALLSILVDKGHVKIESDGPRYLYLPVRSIGDVQQSAVHRLIKTFFRGSTADAVNALIGSNADRLSDAELDALSASIAKAAKKRE